MSYKQQALYPTYTTRFTAPTYPYGELSTGWPVLAALGSYWSRLYEERGILLKYCRSSSLSALQNYITFLEAVACTNRFECPVFHKRRWYALVLRESDLDTGSASFLKYDGSAIYDRSYQYGVPTNNRFHSLPVGQLKHISVLMNKIIDPSLTWVAGTDFFVDSGMLFLRDNPFKQATIPVRTIVDNAGTVIDREIVLWAFDAREDWEYLYQHYGYVLRRKRESSKSYKDFVNAIWDGFVGGQSAQDLEWALCAVAGIPVVREARETVEVVLKYTKKTVVVTDQHSYIYPPESVVKVNAGDIVYAGQSLVDTLQVFDLTNYDDIASLLTSKKVDDDGRLVTRYGAMSSSSTAVARGNAGHTPPSKLIPPESALPMLFGIPVGPGLLPATYKGPLFFKNVAGSVDRSELDDNGLVIGKLNGVLGDKDDIETLWTTAHTNSSTTGKTWLQLYGGTPTWINPAGFIIEHCLRNNAIVVYMRYARFGEEQLGMAISDVLRRTVLPEKLLIFVIDVDIEDNECPSVDAPCELSSSSSTVCDNVQQIGGEVIQTVATATQIGTDTPQAFYPDPCE